MWMNTHLWKDTSSKNYQITSWDAENCLDVTNNSPTPPHICHHLYAAEDSPDVGCLLCVEQASHLAHIQDPFSSARLKLDSIDPKPSPLSALPAGEITNCPFDSPDNCFSQDVPNLSTEDIVPFFQRKNISIPIYSHHATDNEVSTISWYDQFTSEVNSHHTHQDCESDYKTLSKPVLPHMATGDLESRA